MNRISFLLAAVILLICALTIPLTLLFPPAAFIGSGLAFLASAALVASFWKNRAIQNNADNLVDSRRPLLDKNLETERQPSLGAVEAESLNQENDSLKAELNRLSEESDSLKSEIQQYIQNYDSLRNEIKQFTQENQLLKSENSKLTEENNLLKNNPAEKSERWLDLVRECVELFDELERHKPEFDEARFELADHVTFQLREVLERCGVEVIMNDELFDRNRHKPLGTIATKVAVGTAISETLSPGFAVGRSVLRRATVRLQQN